MNPSNEQDSSKANGRRSAVRKAWTKPRMVSEDLFESKGLACLKVATGGPEDCSLLFPGSSTTS